MGSPPDLGPYCNASRNIGAVVVLAGRVFTTVRKFRINKCNSYGLKFFKVVTRIYIQISNLLFQQQVGHIDGFTLNILFCCNNEYATSENNFPIGY